MELRILAIRPARISTRKTVTGVFVSLEERYAIGQSQS